MPISRPARLRASVVRPLALAGALALVIAVALVPSLAAAAPAPTASPAFRGPTTCVGGVIAPGVYSSMTVAGVCSMPAGNVTIQGNLSVAPKALLDAVTKGDPATSPVVPATVVINGNVTVGTGAVLLFGCSPNITCTNPPGITYDRIRGNLYANGAEGVVVHSASIGGSVSLTGGGGGAAAETCAAQYPTEHTPLPTIEPWSEDQGLLYTPVYSDFEDDTIGGNLTVTGLTSCWLGTLRDQIGGSVTFANNTMGDPDAMEVANNLVNGNMVCSSNSPAVQFGDSGAAPNLVGGFGAGQCGFNVTQPNPMAHTTTTHTTTTTTTITVHVTAGIQEHVAVAARSLRTSFGTYTSTTKATLPITTATEAGDKIVAELGSFSITGFGLNGTGTYTPALPPGHSGSALLATVYPNGSESYTLYLDCHCSYGGQTGTITIRAYGTAQPNGYTSGTFFVTSGGGPVTVKSELSTLAGYGTFSGGSTGAVHLVEHLAITPG